jgi:hypothetical protein
MRRLFLITLLPALVFSCGENNKSNDEELDTGTVKQSEQLDTCSCSELDIDSTGNHFFKNKLYTGICVENYPNSDSKYIEKNILNGRLHGRIAYYDKSGEIILEEIYEEGNKKRSGNVDIVICACSELEKVETPGNVAPVRYFLDEIPFTGSCEEYYPNTGQLYMQVNYENGLVHGFTTYFNKDGSTLLIEKYDNGEMISVIH